RPLPRRRRRLPDVRLPRARRSRRPQHRGGDHQPPAPVAADPAGDLGQLPILQRGRHRLRQLADGAADEVPGGRRAAALPVGAGLRRRARQAGGLRLPGRFPDDLLAGPTQRTVPDRGSAGRRRSPHCGRSRAAGRAGPRPGARGHHRDQTRSTGAGDQRSSGGRRAVGSGPVRPAGSGGRRGAGEAVLQAALVRGLVRAAITEIKRGRPAPVISDQVAAAALWAAARYGLRGFAVDPWQAKRVPAAEMVRALIRKITPALEDSNELAWVRSNLRWLLQHGTGADRQRRSARHGLAALTHYLAEQTCWEESEAARPVLSDATTDVQRTSP